MLWWTTYIVVNHLHCGEPPTLWWTTYIVVNHLHCGERPTLWWTTYIMVNDLHCGERPTLWWTTYIVVNDLHCGVVNYKQAIRDFLTNNLKIHVFPFHFIANTQMYYSGETIVLFIKKKKSKQTTDVNKPHWNPGQLHVIIQTCW